MQPAWGGLLDLLFSIIVNIAITFHYIIHVICFSGLRCLDISVPGWGKCWGLSWNPQWTFRVLNMNTQVRFICRHIDDKKVVVFHALFYLIANSYFYFILACSFFSLDVLLCHDDELEGRRIAFILYLVPPWQSSDGGTLDLYATDSEFSTVCVWTCVFVHF